MVAMFFLGLVAGVAATLGCLGWAAATPGVVNESIRTAPRQ